MVQVHHDVAHKKTYAEAVRNYDVGETMNARRKTYNEQDDSKSFYSSSCLQRIRNSIAENGPKLRKAYVRASRDILLWTRGGSFLRALLIFTMGTIVLLTTMVLVIFTLFFVAATVNAIIVSLLISLAIAGGFLALFFICLSAIYITALSVAAFFISSATISAVFSVLIASGWIGVFIAVWLGIRRSLRLVKQSVSMVGLGISGNSFSLHQHQIIQLSL